MASPASPPTYPASQLIRATLLALVAAGAILVTIIFPAEYGLDPTGVGRALGLLRPQVGEGPAPSAPPGSAAGSSAALELTTSALPFRSDEMTVVLESGEGAEVKAVMAAGQRLVFSWTAEGPVDVDMHGDAGSDGAPAPSYWKEEGQSSGHGAFDAPFAGQHGWFWQNLGDAPVKVTVRTSGFYEKLHRP